MAMRLIGDVGGSNARFALSDGPGRYRDEAKLPVAGHDGLIEAAETYLAGRGKVREAVIGVATPVRGDEVRFTNSPWAFSIREAKARLGLDRLSVINDFEAQGWAVPALAPRDVRQLKPGEARPGRPALVIGPGTGLGAAFLLPGADGGPPRVLAGEAGHVTFAPEDETECRLLAAMRAEHGHVSLERLLSGPGLLAVARLLAGMDGEALALDDPRQVSARAADGSCPYCAEAVRRFSRLLGAAAGNLVLTLLAEGGVYVTGGLARGLGDLLDVPELTRAFTAKGRFAPVLEPVPIVQVMRPHSGLLGASVYRL